MKPAQGERIVKVLKDDSVTSARGFRAAGVKAGIKPGSDKRDLGLVHSVAPASAAAVYTTNRVQAAPIAVDREHLAAGKARAVVLNSGNANACTGRQGVADARRMCQVAAEALGLAAEEVLVCSTGVIGVRLPMEAIERGIPDAAAALSEEGGPDAAEAIMTTDTVPKTWAVELELGDRTVRIGGMAKGAGMIAPDMATMLAVIATDAGVEPGLLRELLVRAVRRSFNCITVDGDMSTNDTVIVMANGAAEGQQLAAGTPEVETFYAGLEEVCRQLSRKIARDGEGATKLIAVRVRGARSEREARQVGLAVANSNLVKTAVFGCDPNWGRILCATGYAGVELDPDQVEVALCGTRIYGDGAGQEFDEKALSQTMRAEEIPVEIDLKTGPAEAEVFTCDLSYEYVRINAEYTT